MGIDPGRIESNPNIKKKAFAMLDAMHDAGMDDKDIGTVLLGMAASALRHGNVTREQVHEAIDALYDKTST